MRILLVRHGQSTDNAAGRFVGRIDPPLSDVGQRQVGALARRLERLDIEPPSWSWCTVLASGTHMTRAPVSQTRLHRSASTK